MRQHRQDASFPSYLTNSIKASSDPQQFVRLWRTYRSQFNIVHLSAFIVYLARCLDVDSQEQHAPPIQETLYQYIGDVLPLVEQFDGVAAANTLHGLATLGHSASELIPALLEAIQPKLQAFLPQHLSIILWSLATMEHQPEDAWMHSWCAATQPKLAACSVQTASLSVWALGKLRWRPDALWMSTFLEASLQLLPQAGPQELTAMVYGLSCMQAQPSAEWLVCYQQQCSARLPDFTQAELVQLLTALPGLQLDIREPPLRRWLGRVAARQQEQLAACSATELSLLLAALARLRYKPPAAWLAHYEDVCLHKLPGFSCRALCQVVWAYGQFGPNVSFGFLHRCLDALGPRLDHSNGQDLASVVYAMARMKLRPDKAWVTSFLVNSKAKMGLLAPHQLVHVVWGLSRLRVIPPVDWLRVFVRAARPALRALSAADMQKLDVALQALEMDPQPDWLFDFCEVVRVKAGRKE